MNHDQNQSILTRWEATGEEIRDALEEAVHKTLVEHKRAGRPVVVWDRVNDRVVTLTPEQIDVSDEPAESLVVHQNGVRR